MQSPTKRAIEIARAFRRAPNEDNIPSDVQGSYTGAGDMDEVPVQDADDL